VVVWANGMLSYSGGYSYVETPDCTHFYSRCHGYICPGGRFGRAAGAAGAAMVALCGREKNAMHIH